MTVRRALLPTRGVMRPRGTHQSWLTFALAVALVACGGPAPTEREPSPTPAMPSLTEVGDGRVLGSEWRYAVGEDAGSGWCTRLEVAGVASARCGDLLPAADAAFGEVGRGPDEYAEAHVVEGFVTDDAVTIWLVGDGGQYRIPAVVMPLDDAGVEGAQAYVGFARADVALTHLQAVARNGDVLETHELP